MPFNYPKAHAQQSTMLLVLLVLAVAPSATDGHGYLKTPRSRNYVAYQDGVYWPLLESRPLIETEPQSASTGTTCGIISGRNYDRPMNGLGLPMSWNPQACYMPGGVIDVSVTLTAHHKGHFEFRACPISNQGDVPTENCFASFPLTFVSETLMSYETRSPANPDPNHPERAYVNDNDGELNYRYRLPRGLGGKLVLLQWHYVTANGGCSHAGYQDYDWPVGWTRPMNFTCSAGYANAEQFWNCAEVEISNDCGVPPENVPASASPTTSRPSLRPTSVPTTGAPTSSAATASPTSSAPAIRTRAPTATPTTVPDPRPTSSPTATIPTAAPVGVSTTVPSASAVADARWYPDLGGATKCKNDGGAPSWLHHRYASQSACCTSHYGWAYYDCMGTKPPASHRWYIDWSSGKCKRDCDSSEGGSCGGLVPGSWVILHDSNLACCRAHVSWAVDSCTA